MELGTILLDNALAVERMIRLEAQITTNDHLLNLMERIETLELAQVDLDKTIFKLTNRIRQLEGKTGTDSFKDVGF